MFVILKMGIDSWVYPYVKTDQTVHFKYALFRVLQSHLNKAEKTLREAQPSDWTWKLGDGKTEGGAGFATSQTPQMILMKSENDRRRTSKFAISSTFRMDKGRYVYISKWSRRSFCGSVCTIWLPWLVPSTLLCMKICLVLLPH